MSDLDVWVKTLAETLTPIVRDYRALRSLMEGSALGDEAASVDPIDARTAATACATQSLIRVLVALNEFSELADIVRDGPLVDLLAALEDLRLGNKPSLLQPNPHVTGKLSVKLDMLKARAAASVYVLKQSGFLDVKARQIVAKVFTDAGHRAKKGGPITPSTVFGWCIDCTPDHKGTPQQRIMAEMKGKLPEEMPRTRALELVKKEAAKRF